MNADACLKGKMKSSDEYIEEELPYLETLYYTYIRAVLIPIVLVPFSLQPSIFKLFLRCVISTEYLAAANAKAIVLPHRGAFIREDQLVYLPTFWVFTAMLLRVRLPLHLIRAHVRHGFGIYLRDGAHFAVFLIGDAAWILMLRVALENDAEQSIIDYKSKLNRSVILVRKESACAAWLELTLRYRVGSLFALKELLGVRRLVVLRGI